MAIKNKLKTGVKKATPKLAKKKAVGNRIKKAVKTVKKIAHKKTK